VIQVRPQVRETRHAPYDCQCWSRTTMTTNGHRPSRNGRESDVGRTMMAMMARTTDGDESPARIDWTSCPTMWYAPEHLPAEWKRLRVVETALDVPTSLRLVIVAVAAMFPWFPPRRPWVALDPGPSSWQPIVICVFSNRTCSVKLFSSNFLEIHDSNTLATDRAYNIVAGVGASWHNWCHYIITGVGRDDIGNHFLNSA
jgi:hypothetical protein